MRMIIRMVCVCSLFLVTAFATGCSAMQQESFAAESEPESEITLLTTNYVERAAVTIPAPSQEQEPYVISQGMTLKDRIRVPKGYVRRPADAGSFQEYVRSYPMKADQSPVLLYDGREKSNQAAQASIFDMPVFDSDLQQCADSIIRIYAEYFRSVEAYDRIVFHLTNGFSMDYQTWREGNRLSVEGNHVSWIKKTAPDDSHESFLLYLKYVMMYAGTLSLDEECTPVDIGGIQAGDMFIKGGSPGHCVMVADVAEDAAGNRCFLLAQGYMPAQDFHVLNNPLHDEDPWYYLSELTYPLSTPEYTFSEGSFKRWYGF